MKRDSFRDAATLAFVRYGELRGLTADEYKDRMRRRVAEDCQFFESEMREERILAEITRYAAFFDDLYAVEETLGYFMEKNKEYIVDAVRAVYMSYPHRYPTHGETTYRVRAHSISVPVSEKQVYRWLEEARHIYCKKRGFAVVAPAGFEEYK